MYLDNKTEDELKHPERNAGCLNYIITEGGPLVTFRSDNLVWDFKNLSVREIVVPGQRVQ